MQKIVRRFLTLQEKYMPISMEKCSHFAECGLVCLLYCRHFQFSFVVVLFFRVYCDDSHHIIFLYFPLQLALCRSFFSLSHSRAFSLALTLLQARSSANILGESTTPAANVRPFILMLGAHCNGCDMV